MRLTVSETFVEQRIFILRGAKVMLDADLAGIYGVTVKRLNEAVKRNRERFPADFMFVLNTNEVAEVVRLRSQIATLEKRRGRYSKYLPHAFTEQGVAMLSGVLHSERAIRANVAIMRAFVRMRALGRSNRQLAAKLDELERKVKGHDEEIGRILYAIRRLTTTPDEPRKRIGFRPDAKF